MLDKSTQQHGYTIVCDASDAPTEMLLEMVRVHGREWQSNARHAGSKRCAFGVGIAAHPCALPNQITTPND